MAQTDAAAGVVEREAMEQEAMEQGAVQQGAVEQEAMEQDVVDPWNVTASSNKGIDYNKLIGESFAVLIIYLCY